MKIYGLTGSIATGKSTVSNILREYCNAKIIDADLLARKAVEPDSIGLEKITEEFGPSILLPDGTLNRKKLGDIVFGSSHAIKILNNIVHPEVAKLYNEVADQYRTQGYEAILYDCPLLIEEKLTDTVDEVILVVSSEDAQLERLMARNNLTEDEAIKRIESQMNIKDKIPYGDYLIYNDGDYDQLKDAVIYLGREILKIGKLKVNKGDTF
ncbi:dephospho-CoA kinase [Alkalibaculum bacchi]|uniref:Dephospho-CoA kinase n=2 Tax=Alkalibaculum bacchi TaxID=645887 RepID=A0A366IFZ5_9FIRM|nr:dephospho-CoA kinase [Alkalibaculum bacchi]